MDVKYEYDQGPRYGWASIDVGDSTSSLIIIHGSAGGSRGFIYDGEDMVPTCICSARHASECACPNVPWSYTDEDWDH